MEDRATTHTADYCRNALAEVCSERAVNQGLWPSRSPDLYPCVFWLRCQTALCKNTHSLREGNIRSVTALQKRCRLDTFLNFVKPAWKRKFDTWSSCLKTKSSHCTALHTISKPPQNSRHLENNTKEVPYWESTNISRQRTRFIRHGDLATSDLCTRDVCRNW
jgi:hypothetical protein